MAPIAVSPESQETLADVKSSTGPTPVDEVVRQRLASAVARFTQENPTSKQQHEIAASSLPGGNTRTLLHTSPFPLVMKRGEGPYVWDEDGHK